MSTIPDSDLPKWAVNPAVYSSPLTPGLCPGVGMEKDGEKVGKILNMLDDYERKKSFEILIQYIEVHQKSLVFQFTL